MELFSLGDRVAGVLKLIAHPFRADIKTIKSFNSLPYSFSEPGA
jgi:hypothetical protein